MSALTKAGSTRRWREIRQAILTRDGMTCQRCGRTLHPRCFVTGCPACAHVDHRTPRAHGGSDDPANLIACCQGCNLSRGARNAVQAPVTGIRQEVGAGRFFGDGGRTRTPEVPLGLRPGLDVVDGR